MNTNTRSMIGTMVLIVVLFFLFNLRHEFISPPAVDLNHTFKVDLALERLTRILGSEQPHPVDSDANDAVRERLLNEIRMLGFTPIVRDDFHCVMLSAARCARVRNVMFWVTKPGTNAVMVSSHYDSVPAGPGAADDGAGLAASLEIANILKDRQLSRPLLVLITDGEEPGLIGARSFVEKDPLAKDIAAVVNMEARGVRGITSLIETSRPNSRDLASLKSSTRLAIASSLNTDVYQMMPNSTDMTAFLDMDIDAANYALTGSAAFYHTPSDKLSNLDRDSLFHLGASGLAATEAFFDQSGDEVETQLIYTDLFGLATIIIPQYLGLLIIIAGCFAALALFVIRGGGSPLPSLLYPPLSILLGVGLAFASTALIAWLRPEVNFAAAHPWALRATHNAAVLLGGVAALIVCFRPGSQNRLLHSAWLWFSLIGLALCYFAKGASILFAPPLLLFLGAAVLFYFGNNKSARVISVLAALLFTAIALPLSAAGELGLFIEKAAPFALIPLLIFLLLAPLNVPNNSFSKENKRALLLLTLGGLVISTIISLLVPAYSVSAPRTLSIIHKAGDAPGMAKWSIRSTPALPDEIMRIAPFSIGEFTNIPGKRQIAAAPDLISAGLEIKVLSDQTKDDERLVTLQVTAPDADQLWMPIEDLTSIRAIKIGDHLLSFDTENRSSLVCYGRECRSLKFTLNLAAEQTPPDLTMIALRHGLGKESQQLLAARPEWALPRQWGDLRAVTRAVPLGENHSSRL